MSSLLVWTIFLPVLTGIFVYVLPGRRLKEIIALLSGLVTSGICLVIFMSEGITYSKPWLPFDMSFDLLSTPLSAFCLLFAGLFAVLIIIYSTRFRIENAAVYYSLVLINFGCVNGVLLADNFIVFLLFWEATVIMLYGLLSLGKDTYPVATKSLFILGFADFLLLLGVILLWHLTRGEWKMSSNVYPVQITGNLATVAFLFMIIGALAKAGAMPFHNWIPDSAMKAPASVMAYLPASMDKILGIYLLGRIVLNIFVVKTSTFLLFIGAFTVIAAVFMAMIQHDLKRLLAYHAVSQVGYMVLGIGTATPVGIAGGLFHMLNHAIYKSCLFLCAGNVEQKAGTTDLDKLGGLAKAMPITFIGFLIAAMSISGIPPLNGFVSKWMIYQGIINLNNAANPLWFVWLIAAMFGSILTLASFIKLFNAVFLGRSSYETQKVKKDVSPAMWLPVMALAFICLIFGIFYNRTVLKYFIGQVVSGISFSGQWYSSLATLFIVTGLIIGVIIYYLGNLKKGMRVSKSYIGGETLKPEVRVTGTDFYQTIRDIPGLQKIYQLAERGCFDFYSWAYKFIKNLSVLFYMSADKLLNNTVKAVNYIIGLASEFTSGLHGGVLSVYLYWSLFGLIILLAILLR